MHDNIDRFIKYVKGTVGLTFQIGHVPFLSDNVRFAYLFCSTKTDAKEMKSLAWRTGIDTTQYSFSIQIKDKRPYVLVFEKNGRLSKFKPEWIAEHAVFENISDPNT